jgi:stage III sporulation protein AH
MIGGSNMKIWKKNLMAAAVLVTVCAGIYLNWLYAEDQATADLTDTLDSGKVLSSDMLVMNDSAISDSIDTATDYFAAVRLSRQQARDSAVTLLQEAMSYSNEEVAQQSNADLEDLIQIALCEAQIESLIIAKGYTDCVAYISNEGISVAVATPEGGLQQTDVAVIADVVMTQSDFTLEDIYVVEVQ